MQVIRGTFTRRLLILFIFLSLIPTLIITIIPTFQRIQAEKEYQKQVELQLQQKATSAFINLLSKTATDFTELLQDRSNKLFMVKTNIEDSLADYSHDATISKWIIADHTLQLNNGLIVSLPEEDVMITASFENNTENIEYQQMQAVLSKLQEIRWIIQNDPTIQSMFIKTPSSTVLIPSPLIKTPDYQNHFHEIDFKSLGNDQISMQLTNIDKNPVLSIISPIFFDQNIWGYIGMEIVLESFIQKISTYGLTENLSLFLISDNMDLLAASSRNHDTEFLQKMQIIPGDLIGLNFLEVMPKGISEALIQNQYPEILLKDIPYSFKVYYEDSIAYFGTTSISKSPLHVMMLFPIADLYNQAYSYGASVKINTISIITQAIISVLGFIMVLFVGEYITLRKIARPVAELLKGANSIANGSLDYRVPALEEGEMQELAISFNKMGNVIQKTQLILENKQIELLKNLEEQKREQMLINNITSLSNTLIDLPNKIRNLLYLIVESQSANYCSIHFKALTNGNPIFFERTGITNTIELSTIDFKHICSDLTQKAYTEKKIIIRKKSFQKSEEPERYLAHAVPIILRSQTIGVMVLLYLDSGSISTIHEPFLSILSNHIALLIENVNLQEQAHNSAIYEERRRMARELHDSVSQTVFSLSLTAKSLQSTELSEKARDRLDFMVSQTEVVRRELRTIINELRPLDLTNEGLEEAIRGHISSLQKNTNINVKTCIEMDLNLLSGNIQHNLNRIIQEAMNNIARHSNASKADLTIKCEGNCVVVCIEDNGQGFDRNTTSKLGLSSFGFISMRERAEAINGTLTIDSVPGEGTRIEVVIPYNDIERD